MRLSTSAPTSPDSLLIAQVNFPLDNLGASASVGAGDRRLMNLANQLSVQITRKEADYDITSNNGSTYSVSTPLTRNLRLPYRGQDNYKNTAQDNNDIKLLGKAIVPVEKIKASGGLGAVQILSAEINDTGTQINLRVSNPINNRPGGKPLSITIDVNQDLSKQSVMNIIKDASEQDNRILKLIIGPTPQKSPR